MDTPDDVMQTGTQRQAPRGTTAWPEPEDNGVPPQGTASSLADTIKSSAQSLKDQVVEGVKHAQADAAEKLSGVTDRLRAEGDRLLHAQCERTAGTVAGVAAAFDGVASNLRESDQPQVAAGAEMIARHINDAATYIRERSPSQMLSDVSSAARRHPELFIGGLFVAGVAVARMLKAQAPAPESPMTSGMGESADLGPTTAPADDIAQFGGTSGDMSVGRTPGSNPASNPGNSSGNNPGRARGRTSAGTPGSTPISPSEREL